jgi:hypothetical protein
MAFTSVAIYLGVYRRTGPLRFATSGTGLTVRMMVDARELDEIDRALRGVLDLI